MWSPPQGKSIQLVIFDWAGTTVDFGCFAPVTAFQQTFARHGVEVTVAQVRGPMGLSKKDHLRLLLELPEVAARWHEVQGRDWNVQDLEDLYNDFLPLQLQEIESHSRLVPGLLDCVAELRRRGIRIGATTGYFRQAAERLYPAARQQGFVPDHCLCGEEVPAGRPAPWMIFRAMEALGVYPPVVVVKVGDTVPDIAEGRNAGVWSVGVTRSSSEVGCTEEEFERLPEPQRQEKLTSARNKLFDAGAHSVIETVADLPAVLSDLARAVQRGENP
jgi:phosphonoacetaldehyde hydrolase